MIKVGIVGGTGYRGPAGPAIAQLRGSVAGRVPVQLLLG